MDKESLYNDPAYLREEIRRLESIILNTQWNYIVFNKDGSLYPMPEHRTKVLFKVGESFHAGIFINDLSIGNSIEDISGDYGFFDNSDNFYEVESVIKWMPIYE